VLSAGGKHFDIFAVVLARQRARLRIQLLEFVGLSASSELLQ
jgi:hypothetical protein